MRLAPPFAAAIADSSESTQISRFMIGVPILSRLATNPTAFVHIHSEKYSACDSLAAAE
jgi:hypothetical protein